MKDLNLIAKEYLETNDSNLLVPIYDFVTKISQIRTRERDIQYTNDIAASAFMKIVKNLVQFNPEIAKFETWANTVIENEIKLSYRHINKFKTDESAIFNETYEPAYGERLDEHHYFNETDAVEALDNYIDIYLSKSSAGRQLPADVIKTILTMKYKKGISNQQIETELNIGTQMLKSINHRFLIQFKKYVKKTYSHKIFTSNR